jgi:hypothetical protein
MALTRAMGRGNIAGLNWGQVTPRDNCSLTIRQQRVSSRVWAMFRKEPAKADPDFGRGYGKVNKSQANS